MSPDELVEQVAGYSSLGVTTSYRKQSAMLWLLTVGITALIGPWFVDAFRAPLSSSRVTLHYAILRPRLKDSIVRAQARGGDALTAEEPIRQLWQAFQELGP